MHHDRGGQVVLVFPQQQQPLPWKEINTLFFPLSGLTCIVVGLFYIAVFWQHLLSFTHLKIGGREHEEMASRGMRLGCALDNNLSQIHTRNGVIGCSQYDLILIEVRINCCWRSNPLFSGSVRWPPSLNWGSGSAQGSCLSKSQCTLATVSSVLALTVNTYYGTALIMWRYPNLIWICTVLMSHLNYYAETGPEETRVAAVQEARGDRIQVGAANVTYTPHWSGCCKAKKSKSHFLFLVRVRLISTAIPGGALQNGHILISDMAKQIASVSHGQNRSGGGRRGGHRGRVCGTDWRHGEWHLPAELRCVA